MKYLKSLKKMTKTSFSGNGERLIKKKKRTNK